MENPEHSRSDRTVLNEEVTGGLGAVRILHPPGTFALTPASLISIAALVKHQALLRGIGIDWGSGTGSLAILAARIPDVQRVVGLEISEANVAMARQNILLNGVAGKVTVLVSDSYQPRSEADRETLQALAGQVSFILSNPPSSEGDDGFGYRRMVLRGARDYLVRGGLVFLSISSQYGRPRVERLSEEIPGFVYGGLLASTDWVPFDLSRPDLRHCLELYAQEESRGGLAYTFLHPQTPNLEFINARSALHYFERTGQSPLSQWQTHLFRYIPSRGSGVRGQGSESTKGESRPS